MSRLWNPQGVISLTLSVTELERTVVGNRKKVVLQIVDSNGNGGNVPTGLINITDWDVKNQTLASREPTVTRTEGSGTLVLSSGGSAADVYLLTAYGW
jgi:hypothetical protein